jgi:CheY-like chemotaxis protein
MIKKENPPRYKKVLLIDDDKVDNFISERIIKLASLAEIIVSKSSADDGLAYLKKLTSTPDQLPDIIFLDLGMPAMDGFDFLDEYKKLPDVILAHCKIVVLTNSLEPVPGRAKYAHNHPLVKQFLNKPLTIEALEKI